jgi:S1-C subfamily serine protease
MQVLLGLLLLPSVAATAATQQLSKDVALPAKVSVAIYLPAQLRRYRGLGGIFESGQTLEDAVLSASQVFFTESHMAEAGSENAYGLLLALHPDIVTGNGPLVFTLNYAVFAGDAQPLLKGAESVTIAGFDPAQGDPFDRAIFQATRQVMVAIVNALRPDDLKYPATLTLKSRSLEFAGRQDKPWMTGTGFYINSIGQLLTAAHVLDGCVKIEVKRDEDVVPAQLIARSNIVDLAVLDTGTKSPAFLPFRRALSFDLGEPVTSVGYPLQSLLSASPTLTRGNVSARGGLTGSVGQIQFSAPIQPGSSGGPIVSDGGEVLGITVGTLSTAALARQGVIPQNVNFALESRYVVKFLQKYNLMFTSVDAGLQGDPRAVNQAALAAIVSVECYE